MGGWMAKGRTAGEGEWGANRGLYGGEGCCFISSFFWEGRGDDHTYVTTMKRLQSKTSINWLIRTAVLKGYALSLDSVRPPADTFCNNQYEFL